MDPVWAAAGESSSSPPADPARARADDARLKEVHRVRKENFERTAHADGERQMVPGRSWAAWARALGMLLPPLRRR